jgi:hypothetical protein
LIDSSGAAAGSWLMTSTTSMGAEGGPQPAEGRELVIVDLRHVTIMPPPWPDHWAAALAGAVRDSIYI